MNKVLIYLSFILLELNQVLSATKIVKLHPRIYDTAADPKSETNYKDKIYRVFGNPVPTLKQNQICFRSNGRIHTSRIQCLEKTEISNITIALYHIYRENKKKNRPVNITALENLSKKVNEYTMMDYAIFVKCLLKLVNPMSTGDFKIFANIIEHAMSFRNSSYLVTYVFRKFMKNLRDNHDSDLFIKTDNLIIMKWLPFNNDIIGHALYRFNDNKTEIISIFKDQTSANISLNGLELAGYIPQELLNDILDSTNDEKNISILMIMVSDGLKFKKFFQIPHDLKQFIALSIQGYCKKNYLPTFVGFFLDKNKKEWKEFGTDYFDSFNYKWYKCLLSRLAYFGRLNTSHTGYLESLKENYCISNSTNVISGAKLRVTPIHYSIYPENICINKDLRIPTLFCGDGGVFFNYEELNLKCYDHPLSNKSHGLYDLLLGCYYGEKCYANPAFLDSADVTYVDINLHFLIMQFLKNNFDRLRINVQALANVLDKALGLVEEQTDKYQILYVTSFLKNFLHCLPSISKEKLLLKDKFIYKTFQPFIDGVRGISVYKQTDNNFLPYDIKILTSDNTPARYSYRGKAEVITYISDDTLKWIAKNNYNYYKDLRIDLIVLYQNNLKDSNDYFCRSRIVALQHSMAFGENVMFEVYLKTVDGGEEEPQKHWFRITSQEANLKVVFISEPDISTLRSSLSEFSIEK